MKNQRFRTVAAATFATMLLASCSSEFPTDDASCQFYGDTVWDKCWWFNNSWIFGVGIVGTIYVSCMKYLIEREKKGKKGGFIGMWFGFFIGIPIAMMGALFLTMLFEKMLTNP